MSEPARTTLPTNSEERKGFPLLSGCLNYFPAAIAQVARVSKHGNDKHNPGQPLHHSRGKSMDHGDCILRHTVDLEGYKAALRQGSEVKDLVIYEAAQRAWRALAELQALCEELLDAPLAPAARESEVEQ